MSHHGRTDLGARMSDGIANGQNSGLHPHARADANDDSTIPGARLSAAACGPVSRDDSASARSAPPPSDRTPTERPAAGWVIVTAHGRDLQGGWRVLVDGVGWCRVEAVVVGGATRRQAARSKRRLWVNLGDRLQHVAVAPADLMRICCRAEDVPP